MKEVRVEFHDGTTQRAWLVEINLAAREADLLPDLLRVIGQSGDPADYQITNEGSFVEPVLVISRKGGNVGRARPV